MKTEELAYWKTNTAKQDNTGREFSRHWRLLSSVLHTICTRNHAALLPDFIPGGDGEEAWFFEIMSENLGKTRSWS